VLRVAAGKRKVLHHVERDGEVDRIDLPAAL
jgi:hypothetical protein